MEWSKSNSSRLFVMVVAPLFVIHSVALAPAPQSPETMKAAEALMLWAIPVATGDSMTKLRRQKPDRSCRRRCWRVRERCSECGVKVFIVGCGQLNKPEPGRTRVPPSHQRGWERTRAQQIRP